MAGEHFTQLYQAMLPEIVVQQSSLIELETEVLDSMPEITEYLQAEAIAQVSSW